MEDFATSLADALFMSYEKYFRYPTEEEIDLKFMKKMKKRYLFFIGTKKVNGYMVMLKKI